MPKSLVRFIKQWRTEWAIFTVLLYLASIPITFLIFPDNNLWLGLLIVGAGLFDSINTLADRLAGAEEDKPDEHLR